MGKYVVYLSMLGLLVCLACSEDKKIGEVETLTLDYELPQGKSPADDRIVDRKSVVTKNMDRISCTSTRIRTFIMIVTLILEERMFINCWIRNAWRTW